MTREPGRRLFLASGAAALGATVLPMPAFAVTTSQARSMVDGLVAEVNQVIASGVSEAQMIDRFAQIFDRYADVPTIALYALGADARVATPQQREQFTRVFRRYIAQKYGSRFREFIGGEVVVEDARVVNNFVEVQTTAYLRGEDPFRVDFHVSDRSGRNAFFNIIIEGVNMLLSERTEIGAMLDRRGGNIDALIADLS
ncbi:MlaC/ttg2D family ABC transporter substrate-binding protein [Histidinibacterium aquaticum]|uniref:ABC transporter substrate-binding protein n=1 Tax=Histidinibacterium aquaticum TaxID=2613962 RepID=A0A5J5GH97_9RHOB|nr:ABC transporter substrate-binding protein [Histidinibacterium aquaticum]KAA9007113.1 ABC transporter substrate-binding protein [Histidinibacterium aquaticum]